MRIAFVLLISVALLAELANAQMILASPAFQNLKAIPEKFCCDIVYRDLYKPSIPLVWYRSPAKTQSFILIMDDMDNNNFVNWFVVDIPRNVSSLDEGASDGLMPEGATELINSDGFDSYSGPCPFKEEHRYRVRLFAMPTAHTYIPKIEDPASLVSNFIVSQIQDDALYVAVLVGTFYQGEYVANATVVNATVVNNPKRENLNHRFNATSNHTHHHNTTKSLTPATNATEVPNRHRPWDRDIPIQRFIKPSEVLKPKRVNREIDTDVCATAEQRATPECIIQAAHLAATSNKTPSNDTRSTQTLVSENVRAFERDIDLWECEQEYKQGGVHIVANETQRCPLRVRVTDVDCRKQIFPRQFVCDQSGSNGLGLSPSLMWKDAPEGTASYVVVIEEASDLDFLDDFGNVFWLVTDIPAAVTSIDAGASGKEKKMPPLSIELKNTFGVAGYTAPCPGPHDQRIYRAHVFAMPHRLTNINPTNTKLRASHIVQQLEKQALCMSTSELTFSFKTASVTAAHNIALTTVLPSGNDLSAPGEIKSD